MGRAFAGLFIFGLASCGDPGTTVTPDAPPVSATGDPTAVGAPTGDPVVATIGAAGGTVASADGVVQIVVPAGALSADAQIGVQPIGNNAFGGIGGAYRLTPGDQVFATPVQIVFHYTDDDVGGMIPEALGVAVQDAQGIWHSKQNVSLDPVAHSLTVATTRFAVKPTSVVAQAQIGPADTPPDAGSDWVEHWGYRLVPSSANVKVNHSQDIHVEYCQVSKPTIGWPIEDMYELRDCKPDAPLSGVQVGAFRLEGNGSLTSSGSTATYTAPSFVPDQEICHRMGHWNACVVNTITIVVNGVATKKDISTGIDIVCLMGMKRGATPSDGGTCDTGSTKRIMLESAAGTISDTSTETVRNLEGGVSETYTTTSSTVTIATGDTPALCSSYLLCEGDFITGFAGTMNALQVSLPVAWTQEVTTGRDTTAVYDNQIMFDAENTVQTTLGFAATWDQNATDAMTTMSVELARQVEGPSALGDFDYNAISLEVPTAAVASGEFTVTVQAQHTMFMATKEHVDDVLTRDVNLTFVIQVLDCPECGP